MQDLLNQLFGAGFAIHIGHQCLQLIARLQQRPQAVHFGRNGTRAEVLHALKGEINRQIALTGQSIWHRKGGPWGHGFHAVVKTIHINFKEFAIRNGRLWGGTFAQKVAHHAHDKGQLNLLFSTVKFDIIFDLHPRCPITTHEFLRTIGHFHLP